MNFKEEEAFYILILIKFTSEAKCNVVLASLLLIFLCADEELRNHGRSTDSRAHRQGMGGPAAVQAAWLC